MMKSPLASVATAGLSCSPVVKVLACRSVPSATAASTVGSMRTVTSTGSAAPPSPSVSVMRSVRVGSGSSETLR